MNIETPQEDKIIVDLSTEDMTELDITYESMDYSNIETRRVIWTILDKARHTLKRDIDPSGKMLIEAIPKPSGGCVICFTVLGKNLKSACFHNTLKVHKEPLSATYEFESLDELLSCSDQLCRIHKSLKSDLFTLDGKYRLCVSFDRDAHCIEDLLSEYGTPCRENPLFREFMEEHWKLLANGNAVEMLTIGL